MGKVTAISVEWVGYSFLKKPKLTSSEIGSKFYEKDTKITYIYEYPNWIPWFDPTVNGLGDMTKSIYDTNNSGIVDNAEAVNGFTVGVSVPSNAVFTDTLYDDTALQAAINSLNSSKEDSLGNPTSDGQILSSTVAGVRTWVDLPTGGGGSSTLNTKSFIATSGQTSFNVSQSVQDNGLWSFYLEGQRLFGKNGYGSTAEGTVTVDFTNGVFTSDFPINQGSLVTITYGVPNGISIFGGSDISTSNTLQFYNAVTGVRHGSRTTPITGSLIIDLTGAVEGGCVAVIWQGSSNPNITGISSNDMEISGNITQAGTYTIYFHFLDNFLNVNIFNTGSGDPTPPTNIPATATLMEVFQVNESTPPATANLLTVIEN